MNAESKDRSELVNRYVSGDMPPDEQETFEFAMLDDAELLREVETALALGIAVKKVGDSFSELRAQGVVTPIASKRRAARVPSWLPAAAAASLLTAFGAWMLQPSGHTASRAGFDGMAGNVLVVPLSTIRDVLSTVETEIRLAPHTNVVVLMPQIPPGLYGNLQVSLYDSEGREVSSAEVNSNDGGSIAVSAGLLSNGRYELRLTPASGRPAEAESFVFDVVEAASGSP